MSSSKHIGKISKENQALFPGLICMMQIDLGKGGTWTSIQMIPGPPNVFCKCY